MLPVFLSFLLLHAPSVLAQGNDTCYLLNGNPLPNTGTFFPAFAPCTSGGPSTVCCGINRPRDPGGDARDGEVKDECLPNGLCQNRRIKSGVETFSFFANHCTDPSYPSGKCLDICPSNRGMGGSAQVTPCSGKADSEMWCCGQSKDCCSTGMGVVRLAKVLGQAVPLASSSAPVSSSRTSVVTSVATSSASATSAPGVSGAASPISGQKTGKKKKGLSGGAIAGIVVGVIALVLLVAAIVVIKRRRARAKSDALLESRVEIAPPQYQVTEHRVEKDARGLVELETPISELPAHEAVGTAGSWPQQKGAELHAGSVSRNS